MWSFPEQNPGYGPVHYTNHPTVPGWVFPGGETAGALCRVSPGPSRAGPGRESITVGDWKKLTEGCEKLIRSQLRDSGRRMMDSVVTSDCKYRLDCAAHPRPS